MSAPAQQLLQQGLAALRGGNATAAEEAFRQVLAAGAGDASTCLALAFACVNQGKAEAALQAVDDALVREPRNLRALLFKADHLDRLGQGRAALDFYEAALRVAAGLREVPQDVMQGLQRAQAVTERASRDYEAFLLQTLEQRGFRAEDSARFAESLDIALGRSPMHLQQPTRYYFPGLPQRYFYEREEFAWAAGLEAQTALIREELQALMQEEGHFTPYLESSGQGPQLNDRSNVGSMDWSAHYLWREGAPVQDNLDRCPRTAAALAALPLPMVEGQTPSALFSRLAPGAVIPPHHGMLNTRLICHLPLMVPEDCGYLRVGNERREWREGELLIFDDSIEHEAHNRSARDRVVLLFDIWRPELSETDRHWVTELLLAIAAYQERG
ncbi:aspartyl/asparaginyl beta-hydroxylase domain-containing protein [Parahaliea aestuarii]|uniref:Aspartyl beta-hydroxylase n=1 Tax=Parahaliea aestuarii TaxID=1852021 RepID=A0A5C8ZUV5_9GAMM|nr:aspartyl/asparaginyl beta-hydroxylase domain-containing protein [Parahaliea aestuarii]TXS92236.1 aspartyl beta-hydroxylase [Parahaliea aestuarii]